MTTELSNFFYPNKMGRIALLAMEEVIGHAGVAAMLNRADLSYLVENYPPDDMVKAVSFHDLGKMHGALEELFGPRGGRGIALRTGRACFKYGLREFGTLIGVTDLAFRMLPMEGRLRAGAEHFARMFNHFSDQRVQVEEQADCYLWQIETCPLCWGRKAEEPVCHLAVGLLQEALYWVSGGRYFDVKEITCIAKGDPTCTIWIEKKLSEAA